MVPVLRRIWLAHEVGDTIAAGPIVFATGTPEAEVRCREKVAHDPAIECMGRDPRSSNVRSDPEKYGSFPVAEARNTNKTCPLNRRPDA